MKIMVKRSRWPWGRPDIQVDLSSDDGMLVIEGGKRKSIFYAAEFESPLTENPSHTNLTVLWNRDNNKLYEKN